ncbi:tyrosine-protein phosphatase [Sphingomonas sp. PB2P19]|uniref:tyrosine-protein phosphatase n=1 Tax=Sphingomonas rhamnosi TaxID=3096156 RepID=UPI002FC6687B
MIKMKNLILSSLALVLAAPIASPLGARGPVVAIPQPPVKSPHQRLLPLQGGQNFRDLGGYRTVGGRTVRWGLLYRSGSMHNLTVADYGYLGKLGIRAVCDFRAREERQVEPTNWPAGKSPRMLADDYSMRTMGGGNFDLTKITPEQAKGALAAMYPSILTQFNGQYRRMFAELLSGNAPLAFNCSAGKDRTGIAAALLLTALGVPRETVIEDYLLSNRYYHPERAGPSADQGANPWRNISPAVMRSLSGVNRDAIEAVFKITDRHAGGTAGYLRDELGLGAPEIASLRRMYTA